MSKSKKLGEFDRDHNAKRQLQRCKAYRYWSEGYIEKYSAVMAAWKLISIATYQKLVESLPRRVQAVMDAKEGCQHHIHTYLRTATGCQYNQVL
ncbi:hypothetical protein TNCV_3394601 [Trichonephila clavipes]|nr:hypothetical protein TNCV_3394601 [Trichonephila clavipes]